MSTISGPIRVLHVDDNPDLADLAATFLEREDDQLTVRTATSAADGRELLAGGDVDCIVSDYDMPRQNGIEFLETVREEYPDLPFILYTGKGSEEVASEAISTGVTDYLQKESGPDQYTVLANRIVNAVEHHRSQEALSEQNEILRRYEQMINSMNEGACIYDEGGRFAVVNEYLAEWYDTTPDALEGQPSHLISKIREQVGDDPYRELLDGEREELVGDIEAEFPNHGYAVLEYRLSPLVVNGAVEGIVGVVRDITGRKERERELNRYEAYLEESTDIITVLDDAGTIQYQSPAVERILGYDAGELVGQNGFDFIHPDDVDQVSAEFADLISEPGSTTTVECRFRTTDDEWRWLEVRGTNELTSSSVRGVVTNNRDITARKAYEAELERTTTVLSSLFETLPVGVIAEDSTRNVLAANDQMFDLFDMPGSPDEVTGADCERMAADVSKVFVDPDEFVTRTNDLIDAREPTHEEEFSLRDGRTFTRSYEPLDLPDGEGHLWVYQDITEQKNREQQLRETSSRLEVLFDQSPDMINVHDPAGNILDPNPRFIEKTGYDASELTDMKVWDIDQNITSATANALWKGMDLGDQERVEGVFQRRDGSTFPVEIHVRRIALDGDDRFIVISRDITERKERERTLQQERDRLNQFASVVSHDLRNPLSVAEARLELAREAHDSDHLEAVAQAHERINTLIANILTFARQGETATDVTLLDLADIVEGCWQNVETKDATLVTDVDCSIRADQSQLQQLVENLVRNAVEHGGETVSLTVGELDDGFYIEDTGPGIPDADRESVFDVGNSTADEGTGFGLSIVKQVVEVHNWDILVTEGEEGGARFEITGVELADD